MFIIYFYRPFSNSQNHQSATHITMIFHVFLCYIYIHTYMSNIFLYNRFTDYIPKRLYSYISIYTDISIDYIPIIFLYIFLRISYMSILGIVGARTSLFPPHLWHVPNDGFVPPRELRSLAWRSMATTNGNINGSSKIQHSNNSKWEY